MKYRAYAMSMQMNERLTPVGKFNSQEDFMEKVAFVFNR